MRNSRKKNILTEDWYDIGQRLINKFPQAKYYVAYGERKNGKSYSAKRLIIEKAAVGDKFMYVRRAHKMVTRRKMKKLFDDMQDVAIEHLGAKINYDGFNSFYININEKTSLTVGYCTSIEDAFYEKGIPYNEIKWILFDEFIDYNYFSDEISMFQHTLANIIRDEERQGVKIIMLGNSIGKNCPYFEYFGINVNRVKRGVPTYYVNPKGGTVAVEHTKTRAVNTSKENKSEYFGFGTTESNMIISGDWETKVCETKSVDGIGWNCHRIFVPVYIVAQGQYFELSYYAESYPILFIRSPNIQNGNVSKRIKYFLTLDNSNICINSNGFVPRFGHISNLMGADVIEHFKIVKECLMINRVVYDNELTGTIVSTVIDKLI